MLEIDVWDEELIGAKPDILLIKSSDYDLYQEYLDGELIDKPSQSYKVVPNGERLIEVVAYYLKCINSGTAKISVSTRLHETAGSDYFKLWETMVSLVRSWDPQNYYIVSDLIKNHRYKQLKHTQLLIELSDLIIRNLIEPIVNGSPFSGVKPDDQINDWWNMRALIVDSLDEILIKLKSESYQNCFNIISIQSDLGRIKKLFGKLTGTSLSDSLYCISAFCYRVAKNNLEHGQTAKSFVLLHRSLDLYFQSLCVDNDLIVFSQDKLTYRNSDNMVTLRNSEYQLVSSGSISRNATRHERIKWINYYRNMNLLAHGVYDLSNVEQEKCMTYVLDIVKNIDGNNRWELLGDGFTPENIFNERWLFDIEPDFDTYISEVKSN